MRRPFAHISVTMTIAAALLHPLDLAAQGSERIEAPDAYAVYVLVVPPIWNERSKETLLLQRETAIPSITRCSISFLAGGDPDWEDVEKDFRQANARVKLLPPALPFDVPYRFISRAEIEKDDARLTLKYPGTWQRRPESIEYAAVSAVGFNPSKTRAIVYVGLRSSEHWRFLERLGGEWKPTVLNGGCVGGVAEASPLGGLDRLFRRVGYGSSTSSWNASKSRNQR